MLGHDCGLLLPLLRLLLPSDSPSDTSFFCTFSCQRRRHLRCTCFCVPARTRQAGRQPGEPTELGMVACALPNEPAAAHARPHPWCSLERQAAERQPQHQASLPGPQGLVLLRLLQLAQAPPPPAAATTAPTRGSPNPPRFMHKGT